MEASHASRITIAIISDLKQVLSSLFAVRHHKQLFLWLNAITQTLGKQLRQKLTLSP